MPPAQLCYRRTWAIVAALAPPPLVCRDGPPSPSPHAMTCWTPPHSLHQCGRPPFPTPHVRDKDVVGALPLSLSRTTFPFPRKWPYAFLTPSHCHLSDPAPAPEPRLPHHISLRRHHPFPFSVRAALRSKSPNCPPTHPLSSSSVLQEHSTAATDHRGILVDEERR
jgi:hypothetical protein